MASALNEESVEKKLQNVTNTQDSIQTLSLWIIHHKAHHKKIVRLWFKVLRKAKIPQRLTLFYLCNDVVQHGRKKATVYLESFQGILKLAVAYVREASIRQSILRILKIWEERNVFKGPFIEELKSSVSSDKDSAAAAATFTVPEKPVVKVAKSAKPAEEPAKPKVQVDQKILVEFKPQKVFDKLSTFKRFEAEVDLRSKQLSHLRLDASSIEAVKQLKDRAHGNEFRKQFEDSCVKLEEFVGSFEKGVADRGEVIKALEEGELFYQAQFGEAKIVANAYKIFGTKLNNLKKKLDELKKTLPDAPSPVPSPSVDAPSPGSTPSYEPDIETVDMDMSDEEEGPGHHSTSHTSNVDQHTSEANTSTQKKPTVFFSIKKTPPKSATAVKSTTSDDLEARIAHMLPTLGQGKDTVPSASKKDSSQCNGSQHSSSKSSDSPGVRASALPGHFQQSTSPDTPEDGGGTPLKDEGSSTPVQDEAPEPQPSNPIDFLTKLISQTKKTNPHSSHFLQNLGILATTMKSKSEKHKPSQQSSDSGLEDHPSSPSGKLEAQPAQSWSAWKAKQTQDKSPVNGQEVAAPFSAQPPSPVPPPSQPLSISPTGMLGAYGASPAMPVAEPQQRTPPVMPVAPPSPNIPGLPDISLPPPWLPMTQPPRPPHLSSLPTSPSGIPPPGIPPPNIPQEFGGVPGIPVPVPMPDFLSQTSIEDSLQPETINLDWDEPVIDLLSPPPPINSSPVSAPKGILRNRNSALKEVTLMPLSESEDQPMPISSISTIAAGRSHTVSGPSQPTSPIMTGPKPPPHPPGNLLAPGKRTSLSEDQREFIEKLKRKTSQASGDADTSQLLPKPQIFTRNTVRSNLTTIILTGESDEGADASGDTPEDESQTGSQTEEPIGAPIDRIQMPRFIDPIVDRGRPDGRQPPDFDDIRHSGPLPRSYEYREQREDYRERRDGFLDQRLPPQPRERYADPYRDPYYLARDPYSHPTPPKRPYPDPYYDRGRPPFYPPRY